MRRDRVKRSLKTQEEGKPERGSPEELVAIQRGGSIEAPVADVREDNSEVERALGIDPSVPRDEGERKAVQVMGQDKLEEYRERRDESLAAGDEPRAPPPHPDHPWLEQITMRPGMYCPQQDRVGARSLTLTGIGKIKLPEKSAKSAGWFIIAFPGNPDDIDEAMTQDMVIKIEDQSGEREFILGPGDIVAASDFNCWPVDVTLSRWRLVAGADVIMVIKRGSKLYEEMIRNYRPFMNETDPDLSV